MKIGALVVLVAVAGLGAACGGGGGAPVPAPTVVTRAPSAGVTEATAADVTVVFSEAMDPASVQAGLTVSVTGGAALAGTVAVASDTATFTPAGPFPAAASLTVALSADVRSARGGRLGSPVSWSFTTAHWQPISTAGAPTARTGHTAVWTGSELIVWGGAPATLAGGRYDPATDAWRATAVAGAPAGRTGHSAIWTGHELIVWGGTVAGAAVATGGRYDPATDTWRSMSTAGAPSARAGHTAIWTGTQMVVWGGVPDLSGGRYDPATDTWTATSVTGAPAITAEHRAVWTGTRMAVWGGVNPPPPDPTAGAGIACASYPVNVGGLYDPVADGWTPITTTGAPSARTHHVLAWSGTELLVTAGGVAGGGGRYDPATGTWTAIADAGAPSPRSSPHWAWTGSRLVVWSGGVEGCLIGPRLLGDGGLFDPSTDGWSAAPTAGSTPCLQLNAASAWTGRELLVWGGDGGATGARYTP
jgi:hypothetical protein